MEKLSYQKVSLPLKVMSFATFFLGLFFIFFSHWSWPGLFLSFSFSLLITFSLVHPKYAVAFFTFIMVSRPWEFIEAPLISSFPRDIFYICSLSFVGHSIIQKKFYIRWNLACSFALAYILWTFFSVFVSVDPGFFLYNYVDIFLKGAIIFYLIVNVVDKKEYIYPIQAALVVSILEKAASSFYKSIILGQTADGDRLSAVGLLENSNDIAAILILSIPFLLARFRNGFHPVIKYVLNVIVITIYAYLIWQSKSRGAILGLGALFIVSFFIKLKTNKQRITVLLGGLVCLLILITSVKRGENDINESTNNRLTYWKAGLKMGVKRPLLGVGYGNYQIKLFEYTDGHVGSEGRYKTVHSNWLLPLAETGMPGFVFYMGLWIISLFYSWKLKDSNPEYILAISAYGTTITFLTHTYMLYPWILLGIVVSSYKFKTVDSSQKIEFKTYNLENMYA